MLSSFQDLFQSLFHTIFNPDVSPVELMGLVLFLALVWALIFTLAAVILHPLVYKKPWLVAAGERDYERGGKELNEALGIDVTKEEHIELFMSTWPWIQCVCLQHFVGGCLTVPAVFHLMPDNQETAASLACLGILSEMAWELSDMVTWIYKRYFVKGGKEKVPASLVLLLAIHHSLTSILGIPLILNYRSNHTLHCLCFDLQAAGATALFVKEYSKLLDVSVHSQLRQFQFLTGFALLISIWTRLFHWVYLCSQFILLWYKEQAYWFLAIGGSLALVFSGFNWVFCIKPFYGRFVKFLQLSHDYEKLPPSATIQQRRASLLSLEQAATTVVHPHEVQDELLLMLLAPSSTRRLERRQTVPPNAKLGSSRSNTARNAIKRSSMVMLRSSAGDISNLLAQLKEDEVLKED